MLLPLSRPTETFAGLRSLLVPDTAGGGVVTRTITASSSPRVACGEIGARETGQDIEESIDDEEDEGCWVSYGRSDQGRRRLPPPIPSLAARSALRRACTEDRRLVISRARVMRPDYYVRARRVRGGRLVMRLVEREDDDHTLPPPTTREGDDIAQVDSPTTSAAVADQEEVDAAAAPAPLPASGCFEDVVKYQQCGIGGSPLHHMPFPRMVH